MSKSPTDARSKLIRAARELLPERGVRGLKVREVARRAKVNLGLFHYHFKSKDAFTRVVLQELYEEFFARFSFVTSREKDALKRLRTALTELGRFMRDNRDLSFMLIREAIDGDKVTIDYARSNIPRHAGVVASLVAECQAKGKLRRVPQPIAMAFLMGTLSTPNCVVSVLKRAGTERPFGMTLPQLEKVFLSDDALALRIDLALKGLQP
jgi:AcrR family transcriptional regulator